MTIAFPDLAAFAARVDEMAALTGRERSVVVRNVARDFCYAALAATPMADKVQRRESVGLWVTLRHRYTGRVVTFPGTEEQAEKYGRSWHGIHRIPNLGFAKAGWIGCLRKLGVRPAAKGDSNPAKTTAQDLYNEVLAVQAGDVAAIEVANQTPPIAALDHGGPHNPPHNIGARALAEAARRMDAALVKLRDQQQRAWQP